MTKAKNQLQEVQPQELKPIQDEATALISQAIDKKTDVATMEKLLAMRKDLRAEKAKEEYDKAMAAFQGECPIVERTKQGYNYKYAPIEVIAEQIKPFLFKNGLSYTFNTEEIDNKIIVYCIVTHVAGHTGEPSKAIIAKETKTNMNSSQQSGAVMTYGKRYSLMNALAIMVRDEDNDAKTPNEEGNTPQDSQKQTYANPGEKFEYSTLSYHQQKMIFALLTEKRYKKDNLDGYIKTKFNKESITKLTTDEANTVIEKIKSLKVDTFKEIKKEITEEPEDNRTYEQHYSSDVKGEPEATIDLDIVSSEIDKQNNPEVNYK